MQRIGFLLLLSFVMLLPFSAQSASDGASSLLSSFDRQGISEVNALRPPPKQGFITGKVGVKDYSITFDRVAWTITGTAGDKPVDVKIDHAACTIRGTAMDSGIDLTFKWTPQEVGFDGEAYGYPYWVNINWDGKTATGGIGCSMLDLTFNLQGGTLTGDLGGKPANLKYDEISGRLTGELFKRPVDLKLVNLDLSDFIQHMYLFVR